MNKKIRSTLQIDLLKNFHEQFALNQNHHQALVVKFLAGLSVLLVSFLYATVFQKTYLLNNKLLEKNELSSLILQKGKFILTDEAYIFFSLFICCVLSICFVYILQTAYAFRRDQKVVSKIREYAGGQCSKTFGDYGELLPTVWWIPDIFVILLLLISLFYFGVPFCVFFLQIDFFHVYVRYKILLFLIPLLLMVAGFIFYTRKYKKLLSSNEEIGETINNLR